MLIDFFIIHHSIKRYVQVWAIPRMLTDYRMFFLTVLPSQLAG
ncbi:MAG: hypothetical protein NT166_10850 [Candidatus Aminicenantes bacterium]|nr:hypothetical protein [Candidatus Aminicenantes bacterium]